MHHPFHKMVCYPARGLQTIFMPMGPERIQGHEGSEQSRTRVEDLLYYYIVVAGIR